MTKARFIVWLLSAGILAACSGRAVAPPSQSISGADALLAGLSQPASSAVHITEINTPDYDAGSITVGADGAIYFTGYSSYMSYAGGGITQYTYPVPAGAGSVGNAGFGISTGPDRTIWSTLFTGSPVHPVRGVIASLAPATRKITESYGGTPSGDFFGALASDGLGHVWVIHKTGTSCTTSFRENVDIFDAAERVIASFQPPGAPELHAIARGPDGMMYLSTFNGCPGSVSRIFRVNPTTHALLNTVTLPSGSVVFALTAGPDGNVWFTDSGLNKIGRLTPLGKVTYYALPPQNNGPTGIAVGSDGALWFPEIPPSFSGPSALIGRITTGGSLTQYGFSTSINGTLTGITGGPLGAPLSHTLYLVTNAGVKKLFKLTF